MTLFYQQLNRSNSRDHTYYCTICGAKPRIEDCIIYKSKILTYPICPMCKREGKISRLRTKSFTTKRTWQRELEREKKRID